LPLIVACIAALLWACARHAIGEPFADDFLFLERVRLGGRSRGWMVAALRSIGGRWAGRPTTSCVGGVMLAQPLLIALLHVTLLGASAWLFDRALRRGGMAPAPAAVAAAFPLLVESARMLIGWPSHFQDVGALFFAALALHEASRGRLATLLPAALASLLCKEVGVLTLFLLPWWPARARRQRGAGAPRRRWR
jgi:hypothetical protein